VAHRVTQVWIALSDYDGDEGPVTMMMSLGISPLITTRHGELLLEAAQRIAAAEGRRIRVCRFELVEELAVFGGPNGA
jgi:hypothetical protein